MEPHGLPARRLEANTEDLHDAGSLMRKVTMALVGLVLVLGLPGRR